MGQQTGEITINDDGTGSVTDPMGGPATIEDLTIEGNNFSGKADVNTPMGKITMSMSATADGDNISGSFQTPMGPMAFTGARK
jgi:hypothetical protein